MTKNQIEAVVRNFNGLNNYLNMVKNDPHVKNKDVVEEIRLNIESEIDRLILLETKE